MKKILKPLTRRSFLKGALLSGSACLFIPGSVLGLNGQTSANNRLAIAKVGLAGRGESNLNNLSGEQFVAFCDADERRCGPIRSRFEKVPFYKDFRQMLEKHGKEIDAVAVSTPDHTHAIILKHAMEMGKHVYSEKPLAHSVHEVRTLAQLAEEKKVVSQMGNQGHSYNSIRAFKEWMDAGVIGDIREACLMCDSNYSYISKLDQLKEKHEIPAGLDWDLWLGGAAYRDYSPLYLPGVWRFWTDFGLGVLGDWICHLADPLYYALGLDYPSCVTAHPVDYDPQKHNPVFAPACTVRYEFAASDKHPAFTLTWYDGKSKPERPKEFEGTDQELPNIGGMVTGSEGKIVFGSHGATNLRVLDPEKMKTLSQEPQRIPVSPGHYTEWVQACKGSGEAGSPFSYGAKLSELGILGVIAMRFPGKRLEWDGKKGVFTNNSEANQYLKKSYRKGWEI